MKAKNHLYFNSFLIVFFFMGSLNCEAPDNNVSNIAEDPATIAPAKDENYDLGTLKLPEGFKISVFAEVDKARSLAISPGGTIFIGNREGKKVYAIQDTDGDNKADKMWQIYAGNNPNGVAFRDGDLFVAEINKILKFSDIENKLDNPGDPEVIFDKYPSDFHHGWKFIAFGPDGKLYVPVGINCNICEREKPVYGTITRMDADGSNMEIYVTGVRNSVGFTWHPETGDMWFTDNGRDMLGDDVPPCELNHVIEKGEHFGFPYCNGTIPDPKFGEGKSCDDYKAPAWQFGAHTAPLGLRFYTGGMFPAKYKNNLIVAQHGSWNRSSKVGYKLMFVKVGADKATSAEPFIEGWLNKTTDEAWGRPVDVLQMPDGALLVSDDKAGLIYRVTYGD